MTRVSGTSIVSVVEIAVAATNARDLGRGPCGSERIHSEGPLMKARGSLEMRPTEHTEDTELNWPPSRFLVR